MTAYISSLSHDIIALISILNPIAAASIMIGMVNPPMPSIIRPYSYQSYYNGRHRITCDPV